MRTAMKTLGIAAMLVLAGAVAASADTCFQDSFGNVLIGKGLALPTANNCKTFNGFYNRRAINVSGNVCKAPNNPVTNFPSYYRFNLQVSDSSGFVYFTNFYILTTTNTGSGAFLLPDFGHGAGSISDYTISKILCPPLKLFD